MTLSDGNHHAWGSMVDRCGLPGFGPLYHLRKLRGNGEVNPSQAPRDFLRGDDPQDFSSSWLQGLVDADCIPYLWSTDEEPQPLTYSPANAGQPRPRWFTSPWGHGLSVFENGQRFTYSRPEDYWQNDFSVVVECNTANPRVDGHVVWGDPGLGWLKISGLRAAHFALARGTANPEFHRPNPAHFPLGLVGHVRVAVVVARDEVLIVVNGKRVYHGGTTGVSAPDSLAAPAWTGIVGHGNNFQGECCGGAHYLRALSLHEAMEITAF